MDVNILVEVLDERAKQDKKWGVQNHPDGTGDGVWPEEARRAKAICNSAAKNGDVIWLDILNKEICEAFAESDPKKLRAELIQVAAVAVAWIEAIDRRKDGTDGKGK